MKQTLAFLITLFLFSGQVFGQLQELIKKNEKAIFAIYTYDDYGVATGIGTGFFISSDGIGLSNFHIFEGASWGVVKTVDGKSYQIDKIISSSEQTDLIKLKVDTKGEITPFLTTNSVTLEKGEKVFLIGSSHGIGSSVSEGIISSIISSDKYGTVLQITAPISPSSSGSPVMTFDGKVIGVATFQFAKGQNLNFAIGIGSTNFLRTATTAFAISRPDMLIINERCPTNSELMLNSIEFKENETELNFSFTNVSMGYGASMLIWSNFSDKDEMFVIQDLNTLERYYAKSSTIGTSRENGTSVGLGETKRFKVLFPPVPKNLKRVNIMEGLSSSWKFLDIDLTKYTNLEQQNTENHSKYYALAKLENNHYDEAKTLLSEAIQVNKADHDAYNILGIISYIMDNNYDALLYFSKAIEVSPNNTIYYFNRYRVYFEQKQDYDNALKDINSAIKILPNQGDYYQHRAYVYMAQEEWKKAVSDWDMAINLMGEGQLLLKLRGLSKTWIEDFTGACRDFKDSYRLSNYQDSELKQWIDQICK